jgi:aminoglycoside 3-N-acetyltransferase
VARREEVNARMSMSIRTLLEPVKDRLRPSYRKLRLAVVQRFFSYGPEELVGALRRLGVQPGDSIMVHARFDNHHGFRGTIRAANEAFVEAVGEQGNLLMVSMPYRTSAAEYLRNLQCFDVRRTPSAMGLMSAFFRKRPGVLRSAHPTHPVLALGPRAEWFVADHEHCVYPCGPGSPFEKLLDVGGKVVSFNTPLRMTFLHYLEHRVSPRLDFPLYAETPFEARVIDRHGIEMQVRTYAFGTETLQRRRPEILEGWLRERGLIRGLRVGASSLTVVDLKEVVQVVDEMAAQGKYFYARAPAD